MVLGNIVITRVTYLMTSLLLTSCAHADIKIESSSDKCVVMLNKQKIESELIPPCSIVKVDKTGKNFYQYDNVKVYIIASAPTSLEKLTKWSVTLEDNCTLQSQAVFVEENTLSISAIRKKGLTCPEIGLDEKFYRNFLIEKPK